MPGFRGKHEKVVHSEWISQLDFLSAREKVSQVLEQNHWGKRTITYRLRDWLFSRQRYGGEPFPLVYLDNGKVQPLQLDELPVVLRREI